jgi:hypothetical protein
MPDLHEFSRPFWQPIGQFVMAFGQLEREINTCIGYLLVIHQRQGEVVTSQIKNLVARINLIRRLVILLTADTAIREKAKDLTDELRRLNAYRNKLLHGPLGIYSVQGGYWTKQHFDGNDFKTKTFEVHADEIVANANAAIRVRCDLSNFSREVANDHMKRFEYAPWFEKPPSPFPAEDQSQG